MRHRRNDRRTEEATAGAYPVPGLPPIHVPLQLLAGGTGAAVAVQPGTTAERLR